MAGTTIYWDDPDEGGLRFVEFDAVNTLSPEDPFTITEHPVETGANVTDHIRAEPTRLSIEAKVSTIPNPRDADVALNPLDLVVKEMGAPGTKQITLDVPTPPITPSLGGLVEAGVNAISSAISGPPKATVIDEARHRTVSMTAQAWQRRAPRNRVRDVYEQLIELAQKRILVSVTTTMRDYFEMAIERVAAPQTVEDGNAVTFQVDLKRIHVADSETVEAPKPVEARGATGKNKGAQNPKNDPNAAQKIELQSTISHGITVFTG